ncbi:hypothetical protein [Dongia deserti]|uniref:hypothetical protein n=1 Tax=Dongia deserti TaxID=2268030 RepID=UPI000E650D0F|nr:hypothetical protein [Dongia deserti]
MRENRGLVGVLVIAICGAVLLVSGFYAIVYFEHTHVSVPLILVAVVCAAIMAGTAKAMRKRRG